MLRTVLLLAIFLFTSMAKAESLPLEEIRQRLLGQEVIVLGHRFPEENSLSGFLLEWHLMSDDGYSNYKTTGLFHSYAPVALRGERGTIVLVEQIKDSPKRGGEKDAFGVSIDNSRMLDPDIKLVVKLRSGESIGTTSRYSIVSRPSEGILWLASQMDSMKNNFDTALSKIIGKTLYKAGYTKLFDANLSLKKLLDDNKAKLFDIGTANLTPMKIIDAKFLDVENAVVVKVELPNGKFKLLLSDLRTYLMTHEKSWRSATPSLQEIGISRSGRAILNSAISGNSGQKARPRMAG